MPRPILSLLRLATVAAATMLLVSACGGGGGTSSGGSGGTGSSAVSGNVSSFGPFAFNEPAPDATGASLLAAIGDLLIARAYAQAGLTVTVDGLTVSPNANGAFRIEGVGSGGQVVTVSNGELTCTIIIDVPPGSEVVLEDISFAEGNCSVARIQVVVLDDPSDDFSDDFSDEVSDDFSDEISDDFSDDGPGQQLVTICHRAGPHNITITVAAPAVDAHLGHGDSLGPCDGNGFADDDSSDDSSDDDSSDDDSIG